MCSYRRALSSDRSKLDSDRKLVRDKDGMGDPEFPHFHRFPFPLHASVSLDRSNLGLDFNFWIAVDHVGHRLQHALDVSGV